MKPILILSLCVGLHAASFAQDPSQPPATNPDSPAAPEATVPEATDAAADDSLAPEVPTTPPDSAPVDPTVPPPDMLPDTPPATVPAVEPDTPADPTEFVTERLSPPVPKDGAAWRSKSVQDLIAYLTNEDERVRWYAAYLLGRRGPDAKDAVPALMELLAERTQYEYVRGTAAWALGRIGDPQAVPVLIETLKSGHISVLRNSPVALGQLGAASTEAVPRLLELLDHPGPKGRKPDPTVAVNTAVALWRIGRHERAIPSLEKLTRSSNRIAAFQATVAMGQLQAEPSVVVPPLLAALKHKDSDVRRAASRGLGAIGATAISDLEKALKDGDPNVQRGAVEAFGWMGEPAVAALIVGLDCEAPEARAAAARALGRLGAKAKAAGPKLVQRINDPDPDVREAAAKAEQQVRRP